MTERKPADVPVHSWVDRLVREAEERGEFANLPGLGKPLPGIDKPLDEDWWVREKLRSEDLPADVLLPPALQLRKELAALPETVRHLNDEAAVLAAVRDVNARVAAFIRLPTGPVLPVAPADADTVVGRWRAQRQGGVACRPGAPALADGTPPGGTGAATGRPARRRRRWWWPLGRRRARR